MSVFVIFTDLACVFASSDLRFVRQVLSFRFSMLIEYGLKNFFGFKEGAVVDFKVPKKVDNFDGVSKLLCVKGKNASGKTNLLKALSFLSDFCTKSFQEYKPGDPIYLEPFYRSSEPTEFFIEFKSNEYIYRYELVLTDQKVFRETLFRKGSRKVKIIERIDNNITHSITEFKELTKIKLRPNVSFISSYKQYDLIPLTGVEDAYHFFLKILANVYYSGLHQTQSHEVINAFSKVYYDDEDCLSFAKKVIIDSDTGIKDIRIYKSVDENTGKDKYTPIFDHSVDGSDHSLHIFAESSGTKSLFCQLGRYQTILELGGVLCLDEFDINLHPHVLPKLLELFESSEVNKRNAQLIFTTHNSEILDYVGKYRTYLVDKIDNECYSYRLDEIEGDMLRNDRSILPLYNSGKLGGVPNL